MLLVLQGPTTTRLSTNTFVSHMQNHHLAIVGPHKSWNGSTLDATKIGPPCIQYLFEDDNLQNKNISEDCLHLNIYVPRTIDNTKSKTVMVWIHGGAYTIGAGTSFDGSNLALQGDVIVVTLNYRLGLLGFISTEDSSSPGNYGLWDQKLAIEWTNNNIDRFGGDPNRITIFGESAGGFSVGLQTIAPFNKGLFKRAIFQSGTAHSSGAIARGSRQVAEHAGRLMNCSVVTAAELMTCLRTKSADDVLKYQNVAIYTTFKEAELSDITRCGPVIDGEFITDDPAQILSNKSSDGFKAFKSLDIMTGTNSAEGGIMYIALMAYQESYNFNIGEGIPARVLCELVAPAVSRDLYDNDTKVAERICSAYTKKDANLHEQGRTTLDVFGDVQFLVPTVRTLLAHSARKPTTTNSFQYVFSHHPSFAYIQVYPSWQHGANHADELPFVFGIDTMYPQSVPKPEQEIRLSRQMITYWTNFAKSGNPNRPTKPEVMWPKFTNDERRFLRLDTPLPVAGARYHDNRVSFWLHEVEGKTSTNTGSVRTVLSIDRLLIVTFALFVLFDT